MYGIIQFICLGLLSFAADDSHPIIEDSLDIMPVWSGHPVGFTLLTQPPRQYAAFYDAERRMTVAVRTLDATNWQFVRLPETVGWDSHNFVTMTIDDDGYIHLSGNMHCVPLIYFRTARPHDISSFQRIPSMVGSNEQRCTYPRFLRGADGELMFTYRDGSSGNGDQIYNVYDLESQTWRRFLDQPLTAGEGLRNAYAHGPRRGPDGFFHLCWVWRDTPDCSTNHDLSYARSRDLAHWETSDSSPLNLPITLETGEIVDPVPVGGGIINGNTILGFDSQDRLIISYHKFDDQGNTQLYNARREKDGWKIYQTSQWDYRWEFKGGGAIPFEIRIGGVRVESDGSLSQSYSHPKHGSGQWLLDEATLKPIGKLPRRSSYPPSLSHVESQFPGMQVRWRSDSGKSEEKGVRYAMRWETLPAHRDRPREGQPPAPVMLKLYRLRDD
ncbi:BNR repeat-containing protein [Candidatus Poribacteria bacterium]